MCKRTWVPQQTPSGIDQNIIKGREVIYIQPLHRLDEFWLSLHRVCRLKSRASGTCENEPASRLKYSENVQTDLSTPTDPVQHWSKHNKRTWSDLYTAIASYGWVLVEFTQGSSVKITCKRYMRKWACFEVKVLRKCANGPEYPNRPRPTLIKT